MTGASPKTAKVTKHAKHLYKLQLFSTTGFHQHGIKRGKHNIYSVQYDYVVQNIFMNKHVIIKRWCCYALDEAGTLAARKVPVGPG